jgi:hypothetical protein
MYTKRNERRLFLKIAAGLMAAPLGTINSFARANSFNGSPLRLLTIIDHFGVPTANRSNTWISSPTGDYALEAGHLGSILQPLAAYRDKMLIISNTNAESLIQTRTPGTHHGFVGHILGASEPIDERTASARIPHESIDVTIGNYLHSSMGNRIYPHVFFTDYAARSSPTYCYDTSGILIRSIAGASSGVDTLFGSTTSSSLLAQTHSIAQQDILKKISTRVQMLKTDFTNASYHEKFDAYEDSVSSLAEQLAQQQSGGSCALPDNFDSLSDEGRNIAANHRGDILKVIGQLFTCDMVSSATYAFGGELHNQHNHSFIDSGDAEVNALLNKNMHAASHRDDDISNRTHECIRIHQSELIAQMLDTLSTTIDVDGSPMIDNTVIYMPTCMAHNTHAANDYALAMIAGANTNLKGGFHYDCGGSTNNDVLVTLAQGLNVPITSHGGYQDTGARVSSLNNGPITRMLKNS